MRVRFEFFCPNAKRVSLAGSFNDWNPAAAPLAASSLGEWHIELWLPPGTHEYLFAVDGRWRFDPNAADYVPNIHGGMNAVVEVRPVAVPTRYPRKPRSSFLPARKTKGVKAWGIREECPV